MKRRILLVLFALSLSLTACGKWAPPPYSGPGGIELAGIPLTCPSWNRPLPEFPIIDGSSSTRLMHAAIRAFLTDEHFFFMHSQTYKALSRLFPDSESPADVILAVKYYDETLQEAKDRGADLVITPIAKEGFVFVVNKDNPVDSITQEQLRGIYSGRITCWSELGGETQEIKPFTRNPDSGSQTAMDEFMEGVEITGEEDFEAMYSMGAILDAVQVNKAGIGYNIYSWSMLQNLDNYNLKTIAVDGVKPSNEALSDSSYPLMVYTYSYYNEGNEKAEILTEWLLSDQGQKVIASAGYVGMNGQLPLDVRISFDKDDYKAQRAVKMYYIGLEDSYLERNEWAQPGSFSEYDVYILLEDGEHHRMPWINYTISDRNLKNSLADGKCKGVTVICFAYFVPVGDGIIHYVVLTRERGGEFEVINEGEVSPELLAEVNAFYRHIHEE
jgi:phosphate transport system substrate-binding protein